MIKLLSVKTRRADSTRQAFRDHYEGHHVPLGLRSIERFRWAKYARSHVEAVRSGQIDFDCLTEFWFASREDQQSTRTFAAAPEFRIFDEDDARFLDVSRRFSCELAESQLAGVRPAVDASGTRRVAAVFARPAGVEERAFAQSVEHEARRLALDAAPSSARVSLDLQASPGPRPGEFAAIVSLWAGPGEALPRFEWKGEYAPQGVAELDVVETPRERLYRAQG